MGYNMIDASCKFEFIKYDGIKSVKDAEFYANEVELNEIWHNNRPIKNGVVKSAYYRVKINGITAPVYMTRTAHGAHSYCYIDVEDFNDNFSLDVQVFPLEQSKFLLNKTPECEILPLKRGITPQVERGKVSFQINSFGDYTLIFNGQHLEPITFFITKKVCEEELFNGYDIQYILPDNYAAEETNENLHFEKENTVYYFKSGRYVIDDIILPSNSILYLENGAYLEVVPNLQGKKNYAINIVDKKNIKVLGRGLIDFSACCGGETYDESLKSNKSAIMFKRCENVSFEGVTSINSNTWTLNFIGCKNVYVNNVLFFGYRVFSDGVMLSDCQNGLVENSFVRTGDDAFETKSIGTAVDAAHTDNILFRFNTCWTDKANGYGCVYESLHPTRNVRFENCSVGFANGTWSDHLGCCEIQLGEVFNPNITENIVFENIEIYCTKNKAAINCYIGGSGGRQEGAGTIQNIHYNNIEIKHNHQYVVNLQTWDNENCFINDLYLNNVVSNGILLTEENKRKFVRVKVAGGYNLNKLKVNKE